jgi:hypothetical protein
VVSTRQLTRFSAMFFPGIFHDTLAPPGAYFPFS